MKKSFYFGSIKWHFGWLFHNLKIGFLLRTGLYKAYADYWNKRKIGICTHCSHCCWNYPLMERCNYYDKTKEKNNCLIQDDKPLQCVNQPIDPLEAKLINCQGYKFK